MEIDGPDDTDDNTGPVSLGSIGCYRVGGCTERLSSEPFHRAPCCTGVILFPILTASRCLPRSRRGSLNRRRWIVSSEWLQSRFHPRRDYYTILLQVKLITRAPIRDKYLLTRNRWIFHSSSSERLTENEDNRFFCKPAYRLYSNYISFVRALVFRRIHWDHFEL